MHEGSIAQSIIQNSLEISKREALQSVDIIKIMVGQMHAVVPEMLVQLFDIMKADHPILAQSELKIQEKEVQISCKNCGKETLLNEPIFICPSCGSPDIDIIGGNELHIISIEGERETE